MKLYVTDRDAKEHIISFSMEDWWETDFQAYYTQTPATLSLECLEDTTVYCLALADYRALCAELPQLAEFFLHKLALHSIATQQYPPDDLVGKNYYTPTANGHERDLGPRLTRLREIIRGSSNGTPPKKS